MLRFSDPPAWAKGCFLAVQGKSKERVQDVGEVFTNECEVNAMLDMVKSGDGAHRLPVPGAAVRQRQLPR